MLLRLFIATLAMLLPAVAAAQIYKWVDEDGVVHYSDQPMEGAETIDLPEANSMAPASVRRAAPAGGGTQDDGSDDGRPFSYQSLSIGTPAPEQTLWNIQGTLNVTLNLQPGLRPGDRVRIYFDGEPQLVDAVQFELGEVWRGEHNLQAEVLDQTGKLMIRSEPVRFYVQQTSVLNN